MRDHSRGKSNKKVVGYRTPSRWKAENPQEFQRCFGHLQEPHGPLERSYQEKKYKK